MCTSFVFRKNAVFVGMNFDNDGKEYRISDMGGKGFLLTVKVGGSFFPSVGVNAQGVFVNDQMVDPNANGVYKRQNSKRWVTSKWVDTILKTNMDFSDITTRLGQIEIVNTPHSSTHNLIVDRNGDVCVVEPGRRNLISRREESEWFILTNFPISEYNSLTPKKVTGSGSDRYMQGAVLLEKMKSRMTIEAGFSILKDLQQNNSHWVTELSLMYDALNRELYFCQDRNFEVITKLSLKHHG